MRTSDPECNERGLGQSGHEHESWTHCGNPKVGNILLAYLNYVIVQLKFGPRLRTKKREL